MDPEELGEFSHATYKNEVDGRYKKTKKKIGELVKMIETSNLKLKERISNDVASFAFQSIDDGSTEEFTKRSGVVSKQT